MFGEKDISGDLPCDGENSVSNKFSRHNHKVLDQNKGNPDEKICFSQKGLDFLRESSMNLDGLSSKPSKNTHNSGSQELTLRYLCEHSELACSQKGKEVVCIENSNQDEKWVERDFLNLNESRANSSSSKREVEEEEEFQGENNTSRQKKPKLETLNLSLSLPDVSLSLSASNALQNNVDRTKPTRSTQSLAPSRDNTQTTCSNDFTAASLSYSYSHPFSHNPSCSLTHNSTEYYDYSVGRDDQIWCGGEGTNGSVHSRFRPIGDGVVALNNLGGGGGGVLSMMQGSRVMNKDSCNNSLYKTTSSDNHSFFPSELPARLRMETNSGDLRRRRDSDNRRGLDSTDGGKAQQLSRPERILREIVSESIPVVAQVIQELSDETLESVKEYLKNLFVMPEKREELAALQKQLERRCDLNNDTILKCDKDQLGILVAVKMGLGCFLSAKIQLPVNELVEIFLYRRCRNVNCKSALPVDDCDCKICSTNKGFCSSCMCPVCLNFDCANNTCSWVGCDVCSHWCHAACGIQRNMIKPGPSLKGPSGTSEMQFHCIGCGHASEMFGFVKDVFLICAKDWGLDTLVKELDCVRKIFKGSNDFIGKELHKKADELVSKLENKTLSPSEACNFIVQFFNNADTMSDSPASGASLNELMLTQANLKKDAIPIPPASFLPPKYTMYNVTSSSGQRDLLSNDLLKKDIIGGLKLDDEFQSGKLSKSDGFESLESIVRIKEAEARMFQNKADEAQREAEEYKRMARARTEKLEEEYAQKLSKLCLQETEDRRRKKREELKVLQDSHRDYFKMKMRMQGEIAGLLERMEATKQQWV